MLPLQQFAAERSGTLRELAAEVHRARGVVHASRSTPVIREELVLAHRSLLRAMEAYAFELAVRRLPIPRRLRDDLRLQRAIGGVRRSGGPPP